MKKSARLKRSAAIKPFLKTGLPETARHRMWDQMTEADLAEFKEEHTSKPDNAYKRSKRRDVKECFGKPVKELTLEEFKDYQKPNFHAPDSLKELWPQLTAAEQDLVKQLNQWAFVFPASFDTEEQFLVACACRLERFFGRKFRVQRAGKKRKFKYTSPDIAMY
jgi:hypothetical protein